MMRRRTFLKAAAATGLTLASPLAWRRADAQSAYKGPYWLFVNAGGAWDPRFMFDPTLVSDQNRLYGDIRMIGNIPYAPIGVDMTLLDWETGIGIEDRLMTAEQFLTKYAERLTVINGIDTSTNNHDGGRRAMGSGKLAIGHPALGALIAAAKAAEKPMAFFSGGGYDATNGLVALTRVTDGDALTRVVFPNEINAGEPDTEHYHTDATWNRIRDFQKQRTEALEAKQHLPTIKSSLSALLKSRVANAELKQLEIPDTLVDVEPGELRDLERMMQQGQLALAAFKSGLAVTGSVNLGGFDTHGNHDRDQMRQVLKLLGGVDFIMEEAKRQGLDGNVVVVATSDFGRGPYYNSENDNAGKDHWPVTSMFAMGPGIAGNRVVGATDDEQRALKLDPKSLKLDDSGVVLGPEHVHHALRRVAGISDSAGAGLYPLAGQELPLFGG